MGTAPVMIELTNAISGLTFNAVWNRRVRGLCGTQEVCFISRADLITNKPAAGRPQDIADAAELDSVDNSD